MPNGVPDAARPHFAGRSWPSAPPPSPLDPFSDNRVASRDSQMTRRAVGRPCSSPPDGVITPPSGEPPGPSHSGGHEQHPGLAATRLTFVFQRGGSAFTHWVRFKNPAHPSTGSVRTGFFRSAQQPFLGLRVQFQVSGGNGQDPPPEAWPAALHGLWP